MDRVKGLTPNLTPNPFPPFSLSPRMSVAVLLLSLPISPPVRSLPLLCPLPVRLRQDPGDLADGDGLPLVPQGQPPQLWKLAERLTAQLAGCLPRPTAVTDFSQTRIALFERP